MEKDLQNSQALRHDSELKRAQLQDFIQATAVQMQEDAAKNKLFQDQIISENKQLNNDIRRLQELLDSKEAERLQMMAVFQKEKAQLVSNQKAQLIDRDMKIK